MRQPGRVVGEAGEAGPGRLGGRSQGLEDLVDLADFGVAFEHRLAPEHLAVDAADRPNVDARSVLGLSEKDLRTAVPQGDDLVGQLGEGDREAAGESEVGDFEVSVLVDEDVLRLQVAVDDAVRVADEQSGEDLLQEVETLGLRQPAHHQQLPQVVLQVLEDHVYLAALAVLLSQRRRAV